MHGKILEFLRKKDGYVSGEEISHRLGVSRQALWKHIQELKDSGFEIIAVPHLGYKLLSTPDRLFASEVSSHLGTSIIGKKIYYFDELNSTMDKAMELGLKGCPEGTIVLTESQSKGRGRLGRSWSSPKYKGLYFSFILKPDILPSDTPVFTLLTAVSICEAIEEETHINTQIKWPNDVMLGNKKLGGILTELNAEMDEVRFIIIGVGINVNNDKKGLLSSAVSLKEHAGHDINRICLLQHILRGIERNYLLFKKTGPRKIIERWKDFNITLHRRVKIDSHSRITEGEAVDIDKDGGLLVRKDSGVITKVTSGDVIHCR